MARQDDRKASQRIEELAQSTDEMAVAMMTLATLVDGLVEDGEADLQRTPQRLLAATKEVLLALDIGLTALREAFGRPGPVDLDGHLAYMMGLLRRPLASLEAEVGAIAMLITSNAPSSEVPLQEARRAIDRILSERRDDASR